MADKFGMNTRKWWIVRIQDKWELHPPVAICLEHNMSLKVTKYETLPEAVQAMLQRDRRYTSNMPSVLELLVASDMAAGRFSSTEVAQELVSQW